MFDLYKLASNFCQWKTMMYKSQSNTKSIPSPPKLLMFSACLSRHSRLCMSRVQRTYPKLSALVFSSWLEICGPPLHSQQGRRGCMGVCPTSPLQFCGLTEGMQPSPSVSARRVWYSSMKHTPREYGALIYTVCPLFLVHWCQGLVWHHRQRVGPFSW